MAAVLPYLKGNVLDIGCGVGKLAEQLLPETYLGVDIDEESLSIARRHYPGFCFITMAELETRTDRFDTIIGTAVIEHVKDPIRFLMKLKDHLTPKGSIVLTTPHAAFGWAHTLGSKIGIFSSEANEEHETLFTRKTIIETARRAGLMVEKYERFILGVNQLIIMRQRN